MTQTLVAPAPTTRHGKAHGATWPWWAAAVGATAGAALAWVTHRGIADDGYITLALARNVAEHGCWCVTPGLESNTATSPLFVLVLAAVMLALPPVVALGAVTAGLLAATSVLVSAASRVFGWSWLAGPVAVVLLATSPLIAATVGLETLLALTLLAGLLLAVATGRHGWVGVVCGLLVLTRPDLAGFAVLAAVLRWRRAHVLMVAALATAAPWWAWSLWQFGTPLPDTMVWKQAQTQGLGGRLLHDAAPLFLAKWPAATALALAALAAGVVLLAVRLAARPTHPVTVLVGVGGAAHLVLMMAMGVPPFVWYAGPAVGAALLLLAFAVAARPRSVGWAAVVVLVVAGAGYAARHDWATQGNPFHANGALTDQYAAIAAAVPTGQTVETAHGEVGAIAYFCGDRCRVVDPLSDRGRLSALIEGRLASSATVRALYPGFEPVALVPAQWRTRYGSGLPVWSGYTGWSRLAVERVR